MTSTLFVEELKGRTTGTNANKVIVTSGQTLEVSSNQTIGGTLTVPTVTGNPSFTGGLKVNTITHTGGTTGMAIDTNGFVTHPNKPMCSVTKNADNQTQTISGTNMYTLTGMTSAYGNSHSVNNKSYWNTNNSRFEILDVSLYKSCCVESFLLFNHI